MTGRSLYRFPVRTAVGALILTSLAGCETIQKYTPDFSWTYKIDVQQGIVVTQEMASQIKPGMTREQVRFILGTPLLTDVFHPDRWDYPYRYQYSDGRVEERKFVVYFENNLLARSEGGPLPTEEEFAASRGLRPVKEQTKEADPSAAPEPAPKPPQVQPTATGAPGS